MNYKTMPREELQQLQIERLQMTLNRAYRNVAFYRQAFDAAKIDLEAIRDISDIRRLPFTTRDDLAASYPYGMFAVPLRDIVRVHATSGTTGKPIAVGYTKNDIVHWSELVARQLSAVGITEHDVSRSPSTTAFSPGVWAFTTARN
jgi:phenylacetate-CoA ligase